MNILRRKSFDDLLAHTQEKKLNKALGAFDITLSRPEHLHRSSPSPCRIGRSRSPAPDEWRKLLYASQSLAFLHLHRPLLCHLYRREGDEDQSYPHDTLLCVCRIASSLLRLFSPRATSTSTCRSRLPKMHRAKRRCATYTLAFIFYISGTYIIFTSFVLPHILRGSANVCTLFFWFFITFLKFL